MFVAAGVGRVLSGVHELLRRLGILYDKHRSQEARSRRGSSAVVGGDWVAERAKRWGAAGSFGGRRACVGVVNASSNVSVSSSG
ncbi:hypothetical protein PF010_g33282 [Phytophthora fragariae]|uniref:Uncharacterized protein n=1 Tax=Phytophthora fragariae TaxID=53985 RepID=A0A6A3D579_9STRA|nr:hypothetical protein PF009_g33055 [Phytophthora fragariae]KAE8953576.1 hypothetical protein PF011_g32375 [Phytophthora fragariae]KAE9041851.1 hypothetical protein PF010_g33283 [Phytophthora fragariae]KAE9041875.1 hypothetical protein PF010_g33282 [Phytophthora fragariae]KAE9052133.1 hypothetical protein PF007_g33088 [Phytophthora fragariae]